MKLIKGKNTIWWPPSLYNPFTVYRAYPRKYSKKGAVSFNQRPASGPENDFRPKIARYFSGRVGSVKFHYSAFHSNYFDPIRPDRSRTLVLTRNSKKIKKIREAFSFFIGFEPITLNFKDSSKQPNQTLQCNWKQKQKLQNEARSKTPLKQWWETAGVDKYLWPKFDAIHNFPFIQYLVLLSFFLQNFKAIFIRRFNREYYFLKLIFPRILKKDERIKKGCGKMFLLRALLN
jgi:hypothetical protein